MVEEALREYLGLAAVDRIRARFDHDEEEATRLANEELHATRRERREESGRYDATYSNRRYR